VHKSRLGALVIDCHTDDLVDTTAFWTGALGCEAVPGPGDDRYVSLRGLPAR